MLVYEFTEKHLEQKFVEMVFKGVIFKPNAFRLGKNRLYEFGGGG